MKYAALTAAALAVCFGASYLSARFLRRFFGQSRVKGKTLAVTLLGGILLMACIALGYMGVYSHAGTQAQAALAGSGSVTVEEIRGGYFFDGPGDEKAIIFYPGAKVESAAYAPLMLRLAESGFDCFLAEMPLRFALLGSNAADRFIGAYTYDTWIMAGHSMGGMVAAGYANDHADTVDGVILLAAYTTQPLDSGLKLCSIYGDADGCLEAEVYRSARQYWPEDAQETVIEGGNHAQFGDYGPQKGDGTAAVTGDAQLASAVGAIVGFFG